MFGIFILIYFLHYIWPYFLLACGQGIFYKSNSYDKYFFQNVFTTVAA